MAGFTAPLPRFPCWRFEPNPEAKGCPVRWCRMVDRRVSRLGQLPIVTAIPATVWRFVHSSLSSGVVRCVSVSVEISGHILGLEVLVIHFPRMSFDQPASPPSKSDILTYSSCACESVTPVEHKDESNKSRGEVPPTRSRGQRVGGR